MSIYDALCCDMPNFVWLVYSFSLVITINSNKSWSWGTVCDRQYDTDDVLVGRLLSGFLLDIFFIESQTTDVQLQCMFCVVDTRH